MLVVEAGVMGVCGEDAGDVAVVESEELDPLESGTGEAIEPSPRPRDITAEVEGPDETRWPESLLVVRMRSLKSLYDAKSVRRTGCRRCVKLVG